MLVPNAPHPSLVLTQDGQVLEQGGVRGQVLPAIHIEHAQVVGAGLVKHDVRQALVRLLRDVGAVAQVLEHARDGLDVEGEVRGHVEDVGPMVCVLTGSRCCDLSDAGDALGCVLNSLCVNHGAVPLWTT